MNLHFTGNYGAQERASIYPCWPSEHVEWVDHRTDYLVTVDEFNTLPESHKYNIAVLMEPRTLTPRNYEFVLQNKERFNMIFSTYPDYGDGSDRFKYYAGGARSFIRPEERNLYTKTHNIAAIVSEKRFLGGHVIRHIIREWHRANNINKIDFINPPMDSKVSGLHPYRFELIIENEDDCFFSEKIIDSLLTGCIPIYYTAQNTSYLNMFDLNGIVIVTSLDQLEFTINSDMLNETFYNDRIDAIKHNFEVARRYASFGDVLWNSGLRELVEQNGGLCEVP